MSNYNVRIRGEYTEDDGLRVEIPVTEDYWANLQEGTCPDCSGTWRWAENGYVPGTRKCEDCGSLFNVDKRYEDLDGGHSAIARNVAVMRRERFY